MEIKSGDIFTDGKRTVIVAPSHGLHPFEPPAGELFCYAHDGYRQVGKPVFSVGYLQNPAKHFRKVDPPNEQSNE